MTADAASAVMQSLLLLLSGVLAGEEFIVRYGVQPALRRLDDRAHVAARQALVRVLRVVVPSIMIPTVLVAAATVWVTTAVGETTAWPLRLAGCAALLAFLLFSFLGTVPINIRVDAWDLDAPPADWPREVHRWEVIDVYRSTAALVAFACFVVAVGLQLG